jgi:hypothetical protein
VLELQKEQFGPTGNGNIDVQRQFTYAVGKNDCGFDLVPGAPVRIGAFTPQEATNVVPRIGWYSLKPAYVPRTGTEYTNNRASMWSVGVMLDYCADTKLARFAIAGVVDCKISGTGWFAGMFESSESDHQSKAKASYAMGFGRIVAPIDANWAKVELGCAVGPKLIGNASEAIVAGSAGTATLKHPLTSGWAASAHTVPAWTDGGTIDSGSLVELSPVDGRHFAIKLCL